MLSNSIGQTRPGEELKNSIIFNVDEAHVNQSCIKAQV